MRKVTVSTLAKLAGEVLQYLVIFEGKMIREDGEEEMDSFKVDLETKCGECWFNELEAERGAPTMVCRGRSHAGLVLSSILGANQEIAISLMEIYGKSRHNLFALFGSAGATSTSTEGENSPGNTQDGHF